MPSKSLLSFVVLAVTTAVGDAFVILVPPQQSPFLKPASGSALAAYGYQDDAPLAYYTPAKSSNKAMYHDDNYENAAAATSEQQEWKKIMTMKEYEIENELRNKYGQVFCNNHLNKQDLAELLLEVRRTKKPVEYDEMPIISDGSPGHWIDDKSGDFFRV
jgi:hypothetical protein